MAPEGSPGLAADGLRFRRPSSEAVAGGRLRRGGRAVRWLGPAPTSTFLTAQPAVLVVLGASPAPPPL